MKGFNRKNLFLSFCGLNCGLCPMFLNQYCPGCGGGEGNQSCKIARCSMEHDSVQYCFQCSEYPCEKYDHIDDFDSFITHRNRKSDMEKANILGIFLSQYNDGRKKTLFCVAVNLLELQELQTVLKEIDRKPDMETLTLKEKSAFVAGLLQDAAATKNIDLKLHKKKR